jgi:hypothetical protein
MRKVIILVALISLIACNRDDLKNYVTKSEIITVLKTADLKLTVKFKNLDASIRRLESQIRRLKRGSHEVD